MPHSFYTSLAPHYQHIFPFNPTQIEFLKHVIPYNGARVLDVGCATGELAFALSHFGFPTWAFDFDAQMVQIALKNKSEEAMFPIFEQLNMLAIDERFPESYFDTVICFGNTLVHLLNDDDISQFLKAAFKVLSSEGKLTIQILNYQHIIANQIKSLPLIDNKNIRFERNYEFEDDPGLISFNTKLIVKSTGQEIINSTKLYAIRKNELQQILEKTGFTSIEFFGGFNLEPLTDKNLPLVLSCQKP
jgi:2-polyprenyl-3-methyl-5-hydroxy-6-metoxy-1,4-benzoquinol methylase